VARCADSDCYTSAVVGPIFGNTLQQYSIPVNHGARATVPLGTNLMKEHLVIQMVGMDAILFPYCYPMCAVSELTNLGVPFGQVDVRIHGAAHGASRAGHAQPAHPHRLRIQAFARGERRDDELVVLTAAGVPHRTAAPRRDAPCGT